MINEVMSLVAKKGIRLSLKDDSLVYMAPKGALSEDIKKLVIDNKKEIIALLKSQQAAILQPSLRITKREDSSPCPLSFAQQRLWLLNQINNGSAHYNMPSALKLSGAINFEALNRTFITILERHESLRTCFAVHDEDQLCQVICPAPNFSVTLRDISSYEEGKRQTLIAELMSEEANRPFNLSSDLLLRATLIKQTENEHILLITMHHIASDAWSTPILIREFSALYAAYIRGQENPLEPLAIQYADYAVWQRNLLHGNVLEEQLSYWEEQLADLPVTHSVPLDRPRPSAASFSGKVYSSRLSALMSVQLKSLCRSHGATLFMGLHAAFSAFLSRYSNEHDIVIGTPIANREQSEISGLIGFFVNTLVLRSHLSNQPSLAELIKQSKGTLLDAYSHQQVPFEKIVERLQPERSLSHGTLFQIMLVLQNIEQSTLHLPGLNLSFVDQPDTSAKYDLTLKASESTKGLLFDWQYNSDLFDAGTVERMAHHFNTLLTNMLASPDASVFSANILSDAQRHQVLVEWNDTAASFPQGKLVHELFEAEVLKHPSRKAIFNDHLSLSYEDFNGYANGLAHALFTAGVGPGDVVPVLMKAGVEVPLAFMAVMKSGAVFAPIDLRWPVDRIQTVLGKLAAQVVLVDDSISSDLTDGWNTHVVDLLRVKSRSDNSRLRLAADSPIYIIHTSGSTGNPKGAINRHKGIVNRLAFMDRFFKANNEVVMQTTHHCFDSSVWQFFWPLLSGGSCFIPDTDKSFDVGSIIESISENAVTVADFTPALFSALVEELDSREWPAAPLSTLKALVVGGEAMIISAARKFKKAYPAIDLINAYGPTETSIGVIFYRIPEIPPARIPIGKPINNVSVYVLDQNLAPVPVGVAGELYISGACVGNGYWQDLEQTEKVFIANPFHAQGNPASSQRMYKTGDLAHWQSDGNLEYLGRIDHQVKIRGFRIELSEIEKNLNAHADVKDVVVLARETATGDKCLIAYVVINANATFSSEELTIEALRAHLAKTLPDYMLPSALVLLEAIPLTPGGKVNRNALPDLHVAALQHYVAPRNETEKVLCEIWQNLLGVERVGVTDNFFQLGGHSLTATRLVSRVAKAFNVSLAIKTVFTAQTPATLAQTLLRLDVDIDRPPLVRVERERLMLPSFAQQRLWVLDQIDGGSAHYNMRSALRLSGRIELGALNRTFAVIVQRHESLRTCLSADESGQLFQVIRPSSEFIIHKTDLTGINSGKQQSKLDQLMRAEGNSVFDLNTDLMLRARLIKLEEEEHILLVTMHHIASDGWSISILIKEFSALYDAFARGQENPLPPLEIQYADYAHWQRNWLRGDILEKQVSYWEKQLANLPVAHGLAFDRPRPRIQSFAGTTMHSHIDAHTGKALSRLCQAHGATLFMGLHAAFSVLLSRYSGEADIVVGTPIANREQSETADLIGFFVNTLVLRSNLSGNSSFAQLMEQSKAVLLDAYEHQQVPFEQIVERLQPDRHMNHAALFQIMLVLQNNETSTLDLPGVRFSRLEQPGAIAKYDLTLFVTEHPAGLSLAWEYNTDLFDSETIERMARHFEMLLESLTNAPDVSVLSVNMLSEPELEELLKLGSTGSALDVQLQPRLLQSRFLEQIKIRGSKIAVKTSEKSLTYEALGLLSGKLGERLILGGCETNKLVAIVMEKGWEQVVAVLGILRSGAAYLPIDAHLPLERIKLLLELGEVGQVVATPKFARSLLAESPLSFISIDSDFERCAVAEPAVEGLDPCTGVDELAYVIFTSGSTGVPKGVMVSHKGASNTIDDLCVRFDINADDSILGLSNLNFDLSVFDVFGLLSVGGTIVLAQNSEAKDAVAWNRYLETEAVTIWNTVPAYMQLLTKLEPCKGVSRPLRLIMMAGDRIPTDLPAHIAAQFPDARQVNLGGNTEASIFSSIYHIDEVSKIGKSVPYGKVLTNQHMFVFGSDLRPAPYGVTGEIYIGGAGVALGYWRDDLKTKSSFIIHPLTGERMYKTGDLGRLQLDGNIEFLGRKDFQVKIRGFRIELEEIDNALISHEKVKDAVTSITHTADHEGSLVAYVVLHEADSTTDEKHLALNVSLRQYLTKVLPDYMVPSAFVLLHQLPLSANGKVDRKALPEFDTTTQQQNYVAPRTQMEERLCAVWQEVLGVERIGTADNFFELGGHSLLVMQVIACMQREHIVMTARQLFTTPTLADLAASITQSQEAVTLAFKAPINLIPEKCAQISPCMLSLVELDCDEIGSIVAQVPGGAANIQDIYPLGPLQEGILFHHLLHKEIDPYVIPTLFTLKGNEELKTFLEAMQFLLDRHDVLRTAFMWAGLSRPVQVVYRLVELSVTFVELQEGQDALAYMKMLSAPENQQMDIIRAPLMTVHVAPGFKADDYLVLIRVHHITFDHVGMEIIQREIHQFRSGQAHLLPLTVPYREFIAHVEHQAGKDAQSYFRRMLGDQQAPAALFNLTDVHGDGSRIVEIRELVAVQISTRLRVIARNLQVTPPTLFHAAWAIVMANATGRDDVVFGSVVSGRLQGTVGAESTLGLFINTLPIRIKLSNLNALQLVRQTHQSLLDLLLHEHASLAMAQSCANQPVGTPLFNSVLNCRHSRADSTFDVITGQERTNYPIYLAIDDYGDDFILDLQLDSSVDAEQVVGYVKAALAALVEAIDTQSSLPASLIFVMTEAERERWTVGGLREHRAIADVPCRGNHNAYLEPRSEVESVLCEIWRDVLAVDQVGINDDFFELGGNSLLVIRLASQVSRELGVELPLKLIFVKSTLAALADVVSILCQSARRV
ncbi:amino acid adenylation domain-containing protein [Pseudomonas sp. ESBL9]|uniref:amino acid adenylation domain-containing protein n=1 Tax=Pseudomonas sp. ESBL9 TaxID=3077327 RepID=UPI002FCB1785